MSVPHIQFEASYKALVDEFTKPVVVFDDTLQLIYSNRQYRLRFGRDAGELADLVDRHALAKIGSLSAYFEQEACWNSAVIIPDFHGQAHWLKLMPMAEGDARRYAGVLEPERIRLITTNRVDLPTDNLTGLPDRYAFHQELARRTESKPDDQDFAVLYIDLDHFKDINELYGHNIGDQLLRHCAGQIRSMLRHDDLIARVSGDEFAAIVSWEDQFEMHILCQRLMRFFERPVLLNQTSYQCTLSIGVAFYPEQGQSAEDLLINAEKAMFNAKQLGRAQFQLFDRQHSQKVEQQQRLAESLRRELKQYPAHFKAAYQPLFGVQNGEFRGLEVLARWKSSIHGTVPPVDFIPLAESRGLINALTARLFENIRHDLPAAPEGSERPLLAVNVAAQQISDPVFERMLLHFSRDVRQLGWQLEVELTESQLMTQIDGLLARLESWRERGIRIAIDDFGTGYSCLAYLHTLPVDKLKIDRQFLQAQTEGRKEDQIMYAIMSMANALGIEVLAEGVETAEQLERLRQLGCAVGQGYGLAPPQSWHTKLLQPLQQTDSESVTSN